MPCHARWLKCWRPCVWQGELPPAFSPRSAACLARPGRRCGARCSPTPACSWRARLPALAPRRPGCTPHTQGHHLPTRGPWVPMQAYAGPSPPSSPSPPRRPAPAGPDPVAGKQLPERPRLPARLAGARGAARSGRAVAVGQPRPGRRAAARAALAQHLLAVSAALRCTALRCTAPWEAHRDAPLGIGMAVGALSALGCSRERCRLG